MLEAEGSLLCPVKAMKNMMELVPADANKLELIEIIISMPCDFYHEYKEYY